MTTLNQEAMLAPTDQLKPKEPIDERGLSLVEREAQAKASELEARASLAAEIAVATHNRYGITHDLELTEVVHPHKTEK